VEQQSKCDCPPDSQGNRMNVGVSYQMQHPD